MKNRAENLLDILDKLSDVQFQKDVWIDGKFWDRIINLPEALETLEDYNFFEDIKINKYDFSIEDINYIQNFIEMISNYNEEQKDPEVMLKDSKWSKIVEDSKIVFAILHSNKHKIID